MWWTCYRMTTVMASLTLKMRTIPTLTMKTTNCKVFPFPPEIIQFEMIHLPNCSQSTTMLPFRNLLKYCSDKKIKTKMSPFSICISCTFWIKMKVMVFCCQNCSDLLWEMIVLLFEKTFEIQGWRPKICKNFEIARTIYSNSESSEKILVTECFFNLFLEVSQI